ncbi:MAG: hypothetical protein QOH39_1603 [Verrucomicrobiota bacterium]|jgi:hypothetical protein
MSTSGQTQPISIADSLIGTAAKGISAVRWDAQRERIYSWLRDQGGLGFADAFKGAAILMHSKPPAYVRFVCHAVRDITNGLPAVIANQERKQVQYHQLMDEILAQWTSERLPRGPIAVTNVALEHQISGRFEEITISAELVEKFATLLNEHEQGRARGKGNPLSFLEASIPEIAGRADLLEIPRAQWKALQADAHHDAHENGNGCSADDEAACANLFARFESLLGSLAGSYYLSLENIDAILDEANA